MRVRTDPTALTSVLRRVLDVLWYAVVVGAPLIGAVVALGVVQGWGPTVEMPLHFTPDPTAHEISGPIAGMRNARIEDAAGTLRFEAHPAVVLGALAIALMGVVVVLVVLHQLRGLVATLSAGTPFVLANARRLRVVGLAVIGSELATVGVKLALSLWATHNLTVQGLTIRWEFRPHIAVLLLGALILLIAEVFRVGTRLQQDHDLTI
ncbi:MAG TPA: DUF2975 domain-containing protein [Euzebyales bacterium]|nr:DUF2975 domain-containing protein [Euzebyales bacterium]